MRLWMLKLSAICSSVRFRLPKVTKPCYLARMKVGALKCSARQYIDDWGAAGSYAVIASDLRYSVPRFCGTIQLSTFEVTALDLVGFHHHGRIEPGRTRTVRPAGPVGSTCTSRRGLAEGFLPG